LLAEYIEWFTLKFVTLNFFLQNEEKNVAQLVPKDLEKREILVNSK
jgi:hypothetical protein